MNRRAFEGVAGGRMTDSQMFMRWSHIASGIKETCGSFVFRFIERKRKPGNLFTGPPVVCFDYINLKNNLSEDSIQNRSIDTGSRI